MGRVATAIARETRCRGIRQVLSPVVNLATDVRWGRTEETYGEDPLLASAMAAAFVSPFERPASSPRRSISWPTSAKAGGTVTR